MSFDNEQVETLKQLIIDAIASRGLVDKNMLNEAIMSLRQTAATDDDLQKTHNAIMGEKSARQKLERRLSQLETDVQAIDSKMNQVLAGIVEFAQTQTSNLDDVRQLKLELNVVSTAIETLLELSRQRQATNSHFLDKQSQHSEMLSKLANEALSREQAIIELESKLSDAQAVVISNERRLEQLGKDVDSLNALLIGMDKFVTLVTSKQARSIIVGAFALLVSSAFNIDLGQVVEFIVSLLGS